VSTAAAEPALPRATARRWRLVAFAWGLAEATLFFVVPDVWITRVALRSRREALRCVALAAAGAVVGGAVVYLWASRDPAAVRAAFDALPAIAPSLIDQAGAAWQRHGALAPLLGAFSGVPYKLYAAHAPDALALGTFLLLSVPVRALRFLVLALLAAAIARRATPRFGARKVLAAWALAWAANYALYWSLMPN